MTNNYKEYLEKIKEKLDAMNKAAGVNPQQKISAAQTNGGMPSNDIFDMLGNGAKMWQEKNKINNP